MKDRLSIQRAASEHPRALAIVNKRESICYEELAHRVKSITATIVKKLPQDNAQDCLVSLVAVNTLETILVIYALLEIEQPFALIYPTEPTQRRQQLLQSLQPALHIEDTQNLSSAQPSASPLSAVGEEPKIAAVLFTSGSSGKPKGVCLARCAFLASAQLTEQVLPLGADDRWLLSLGLAHIGGLSILTRSLIARSAIVLPEMRSFDPATTAALIRRFRITHLSLVPTMLQRLLNHDTRWRAPDHLRAVIVGGAPLSKDLQVNALERGVPLYATYGMTETCSQLTLTKVTGDSKGVGAPLSPMQVRSVDGRIEVHGPTLFKSYWASKEPEKTSDGWFQTQDYGFLDERGQLQISGRADRIINSGGKKIHPEVVEATLAPLLGAGNFSVVAEPSVEWGSIVVCLLDDASAQVSDEMLRQHCVQQLAPHERPKKYVRVAHLPRTATGKVDHRAAQSLLQR